MQDARYLRQKKVSARARRRLTGIVYILIMKSPSKVVKTRTSMTFLYTIFARALNFSHLRVFWAIVVFRLHWIYRWRAFFFFMSSGAFFIYFFLALKGNETRQTSRSIDSNFLWLTIDVCDWTSASSDPSRSHFVRIAHMLQQWKCDSWIMTIMLIAVKSN